MLSTPIKRAKRAANFEKNRKNGITIIDDNYRAVVTQIDMNHVQVIITRVVITPVSSSIFEASFQAVLDQVGQLLMTLQKEDMKTS